MMRSIFSHDYGRDAQQWIVKECQYLIKRMSKRKINMASHSRIRGLLSTTKSKAIPARWS
jgi:hypothetical protein